MFDIKQFRQYLVKESLEPIGLWSPEAEELIIATVAVESYCGAFVHQIKGPACGIAQMEPATFYDIWSRLSKDKPDLINKIKAHCNMEINPSPEDMVWNLRLSIIMCRLRYYTYEDKLPRANDIDGMWDIYKKRYNTADGATKQYDFINKYRMFTGKK